MVGDRRGGLDQLLQGGDAGVGSLQDLHAVADAVEEVVDVVGAVVERLTGEEVGRVIEGGVDLFAGGEAVLRGWVQIRGRPARKQGLGNRGRNSDAGGL